MCYVVFEIDCKLALMATSAYAPLPSSATPSDPPPAYASTQGYQGPSYPNTYKYGDQTSAATPAYPGKLA